MSLFLGPLPLFEFECPPILEKKPEIRELSMVTVAKSLRSKGTQVIHSQPRQSGPINGHLWLATRQVG